MTRFSPRFRTLATVVATFAFLSTGTQTATAGERYFVLIFGSQSIPKRPKYTHVWASVVKAKRLARVQAGPATALCVAEGKRWRRRGSDLSTYDLELHTISWMPATLDIKVWTKKPEPGVNLDLYSTLKLMMKFKERISLWGPYEITASTYDLALRQKALMESGLVRYLCIDTFAQDIMVKDCIHAVTDADPEFDRRHYRLFRFGDDASHHIARQFWERGILIDEDADHTWLFHRLGLHCYPIVRREYRYRPGPFDDFGWRFRR